MADHKIMFVCKANSTRSQMAEGFARHLATGRPFVIASSGLKSTAVNPKAVEFMSDVGIDITSHTSNALSEFSPDDFDVVISLCGCGVNLPSEWAFKGKEGKVFEDWSLTDPVGHPEEVYVRVRDRIKERVARLLDMLEGKVQISDSAREFLAEDLKDNAKKVVMVSRTTCPYCTRAKELFKGIDGFDYSANLHTIEVNLRTDEDDLLAAVKDLVGAKSTPQIWVAGQHVGGCDATTALHESGKLTEMLVAAGLVSQ